MSEQDTHSIADIERDTGLAKDTLRVWERRYGFPTPQRNEGGERVYDGQQLQRLRHIRRLLDAGFRPGKVVPLSLDQLLALDTQADPRRIQPARIAPATPEAPGPDLDHWMALLRERKGPALSAAMQRWGLAHGLAALVNDGVAPMNHRVGQAWSRGELAVFEEHLYTELVQRLLRAGLAQVGDSRVAGAPRVLLTTVPGEAHTLGLLMAECMLVLEGCETVSLGGQTPLRDIVDAARTCEADVVALGFTATLKPRDVRAALTQLRQMLPPSIALWSGGNCPALQRHPRGAPPLPGHAHFGDLAKIASGVASWRLSRAD